MTRWKLYPFYIQQVDGSVNAKFDAANFVDERILKNAESLRLKVYICPAGFATIGYGHKLVPGESYPDGITKEKAEELFDNDVHIACNHVWKLVPGVKFNRNQMTALVSMIFNTGSAPLYGTPGRLLKEKKFKEAAESFTLYRHAHGPGKPCRSGCNGLLKRRQKERDLFNRPVSVT